MSLARVSELDAGRKPYDISMKKCSYCGAEYPDDAVECAIDRTPLKPPGNPPPAPALPERPEHFFPALSGEDRQKDLVTIMTCGTLQAADAVVSRLRAAGIEAFLPDESLMQVIGWNLNTYGYVRVQIAPRDYDEAKDLLRGVDHSD